MPLRPNVRCFMMTPALLSGGHRRCFRLPSPSQPRDRQAVEVDVPRARSIDCRQPQRRMPGCFPCVVTSPPPSSRARCSRRAAASQAQSYPYPPDPFRRAVSAGRKHRHLRADHRRQAGRRLGPAARDRQSRGRGRLGRRGDRGEGAARRLHHRPRAGQQSRRRPGRPLEEELRHAEGLRADLARGAHAAGDRGQRQLAAQVDEGSGRGSQGEAGRVDVCDGRRRGEQPRDGRVLQHRAQASTRSTCRTRAADRACSTFAPAA